MTERKVQTTKIGGNVDYAKVSERLKLFREDCPNGSIATSYDFMDNGMVAFKSYILKDKSNPESADSTGHAFGETKNKKEFEKLESIATGRALANLGYLASGEIASSEEMEEFYKFQSQKKAEELQKGREAVEFAKDMTELKKVWINLPAEIKTELEEVKNETKKRLEAKSETNRP